MRGLGDLLNLTTAGSLPRQPILPDSALPSALQRNQLASRTLLYSPNAFDADIASETALWGWIQRHGGLKTCCRIPELGAPIWSQPPWQVMPSNGLRFQYPFAVNTATIPFTGVDTLIGSFQVENGFDGALTGFYPFFNGTGFDEGSGNIIWRLLVGQRYAKTLGDVLFAFTDLGTATALAIPGSSWRLCSGQTVQVFANIPAASPVSGGQIGAVCTGWTFPRR
jgi:hypothetical protein